MPSDRSTLARKDCEEAGQGLIDNNQSPVCKDPRGSCIWSQLQAVASGSRAASENGPLLSVPSPLFLHAPDPRRSSVRCLDTEEHSRVATSVGKMWGEWLADKHALTCQWKDTLSRSEARLRHNATKICWDQRCGCWPIAPVGDP